jgi:hypothetical protein
VPVKSWQPAPGTKIERLELTYLLKSALLHGNGTSAYSAIDVGVTFHVQLGADESPRALMQANVHRMGELLREELRREAKKMGLIALVTGDEATVFAEDDVDL